MRETWQVCYYPTQLGGVPGTYPLLAQLQGSTEYTAVVFYCLNIALKKLLLCMRWKQKQDSIVGIYMYMCCGICSFGVKICRIRIKEDQPCLFGIMTSYTQTDRQSHRQTHTQTDTDSPSILHFIYIHVHNMQCIIQWCVASST